MGHRPPRDKRTTTHVALVARAFGAQGIIIAGSRDLELERRVKRVVEDWGGDFFIQTGKPWRGVVEEWRSQGGKLVHLTMYGLPLDEAMDELRGKDLLVAVGAEKMPGEMFDLADYNLAVGSQPHSEVAALAVFLDRLFKGAELKKEFKGAKLRVIPSQKGKKIAKFG